MLSFTCERRKLTASFLSLTYLELKKKKYSWRIEQSLRINTFSSVYFPIKLTRFIPSYSPSTSTAAISLRGASIIWRGEAADVNQRKLVMFFYPWRLCVRGRRVLPLGQFGCPLTAVPGTAVPLLSTHQHMPTAGQHWMGVYWPSSSHWGLRVPSRCFTEAASFWHLVITGAGWKYGKRDEKDQKKRFINAKESSKSSGLKCQSHLV